MKLRFVVSSTKKNKFERKLEEEISFLQETTKNKKSNPNSTLNSIHHHHLPASTTTSTPQSNQFTATSTPPSPSKINNLNSRNFRRSSNSNLKSNPNPNDTTQNHNPTSSQSSNSNNPFDPFLIGPNGQTLLHYACQNHPSPECLQTLLDCLHPSTLLRPDNDGNLPIHMAMTNGADHDALWVLIRNAPHSVHIANRFGYRAWDWVWERCHYELITLARTTNSNESKLWKEKVWNTIDALVKAAAGEWEDDQVVQQNTDSNFASSTKARGSTTSTRTCSSGRTLLHMIADFDFDCPINLIQAILDEYPTMTNEKDSYGRVPIAHAAAKKECGCYGEDDEEMDGACIVYGNDRIRTFRTTRNVATLGPQHSNTHSHGGSMGCSNHQNECTFSSLPFTSLMIRMLILANPMALMEEDHSGRIALHMAIDAGRGWKDIIRTMARSAPDSMQKMDPITNLYPVMMLSSRMGGQSDLKGNAQQQPTGVDDIYEAMSFCVQVCCNV